MAALSVAGKEDNRKGNLPEGRCKELFLQPGVGTPTKLPLRLLGLPFISDCCVLSVLFFQGRSTS